MSYSLFTISYSLFFPRERLFKYATLLSKAGIGGRPEPSAACGRRSEAEGQ